VVRVASVLVTPARPAQRSFSARTLLIVAIISLRHSVASVKERYMSATGKRTVQINVRLSDDDFELIRKAAAKLWPDAVLSNSAIVLGLARLAAKQTLESSKKPKGV